MINTVKICRTEGFTLIELLITMALIGFIVATIYSFYLTGLRSWNRGSDNIEAQQSARIALARIINEIQHAYDLELLDNNHEIRFRLNKDSRIRCFRLVQDELVYEAYTAGNSIYFHTKIALGITGLHFDVDQNNLLTITICAGQDEDDLATIVSSIKPRNLP